MRELKTQSLLLNTLRGERQKVPPIWMMRQAGRYLPEYRELRAKAGSFLSLCLTPEFAAEVTLQPIRRFDFDAAIIFSDILIVPHALGQELTFAEGEGPRLAPVFEDVPGILDNDLDQTKFTPVYETVRRVSQSLPATVGLLGFCGAPWTVATYMAAGQGTAEQAPARRLAYRNPSLFQKLIDRLVHASIEYLSGQFAAGVDAVQIFDTWSGVLPPEEFARWCVAPAKDIVDGVRARHPGAKIIGFPRGAGTSLLRYVDDVAVDAVSLDWTVDRSFARELQKRCVVQGNLDPHVLLAGGEALDRAVDAILAAFSERPFIFNLGHGILPETPVAHVERMIARVRGQ